MRAENNRGGSRPGAGRPNGTRTTEPRTHIAISAALAEQIRIRAEAEGVTLRAWAEDAVRKKLDGGAAE